MLHANKYFRKRGKRREKRETGRATIVVFRYVYDQIASILVLRIITCTVLFGRVFYIRLVSPVSLRQRHKTFHVFDIEESIEWTDDRLTYADPYY